MNDIIHVKKLVRVLVRTVSEMGIEEAVLRLAFC